MLAMLAAGALVSAACSTLPPRQWPRHDERRVVVTFTNRGGPIELPVSSPSLSILSMTFEPAPQRQLFRAGRRWIEPGPDCPSITVRCHYRAYCRPGDRPPPPTALFPGAADLETLPDGAQLR